MRAVPEELVQEYLKKLRENDGFPQGFYLETTEYTLLEIEIYLRKLGVIKCIEESRIYDEALRSRTCLKYEIFD